MSFNVFFPIFSSGGHLVKRNETVWEILVEGHPSNIPVKLFQNPSTCSGGQDIKKVFFYIFLALVAILFSKAERFDEILVEGHPSNIPEKLFQNPSTRSEVVKGFFYF